MDKSIDAIVCGSCTVDVIVRPLDLDHAIGRGTLHRVDPIRVTTGGIVSNAGIALARLGARVTAMTYVGDDDWGPIVRRKYQAEGIDASGLVVHPTLPTSASVVTVAPDGERSFIHSQGAPKQLDRQFFLDRRNLIARSRMLLMGYYSLMPKLEPDLAEVLAEIRGCGCGTAIDAAGTGGTMQPLDAMFPYLDVYVPSLKEAAQQTGESEPQRILEAFRDWGAVHLVGVKLGSRGALLSPAPGETIEIDPVTPPGDVQDTTGAGDAFCAGLLGGLLRGMSVADAGRLAAATGACCITGVGASAGLRDYPGTAGVAGLGAS
jgi:sugar/nucleoside kinase (ribokinase family)